MKCEVCGHQLYPRKQRSYESFLCVPVKDWRKFLRREYAISQAKGDAYYSAVWRSVELFGRFEPCPQCGTYTFMGPDVHVHILYRPEGPITSEPSAGKCPPVRAGAACDKEPVTDLIADRCVALEQCVCGHVLTDALGRPWDSHATYVLVTGRSVRIYQRFYHEMKKIFTARSAEEKREAVALTSPYTGLMHLCGECKRLLVRFPPCEKKRPASFELVRVVEPRCGCTLSPDGKWRAEPVARAPLESQI